MGENFKEGCYNREQDSDNGKKRRKKEGIYQRERHNLETER
jgi:hypothetical protein